MSLVANQDVRNILGISAFNAVAVREALRHIHRAAFPSGTLTLEELTALGDVELAERVHGGAAALLRIEPRTLVFVSTVRGQGEVAVAGADRGTVDRLGAALVAALRDGTGEDDRIPVTFWAHSSGLPLNPRRLVTAPRWASIRRNYTRSTRSALDGLMSAQGPGPGGLLLWHGDPGTGKSYALRALAREWRGWCDMHFISDPDAFLGSRTNYLFSALGRRDVEPADDDRCCLVVLEDAGELLAGDARAVAGQALSRLLNVTDGLLGEGMRAVVLVTTNEPLRRLHEAVVRPGRCWAQVEFGALASGEADAWLAARGSAGIAHDATLAELFAIAHGRRPRARASLGFG